MSRKYKRIPKNTESKRYDFEKNQKLIDDFIETYIIKNKSLPSKNEICEGTGLTAKTIYVHNQRQGILEYIKKDNRHMVNSVVRKLLRTYFKNGKTTDAKLLLQLLADFSEKIEHSGNAIEKISVEVIQSKE